MKKLTISLLSILAVASLSLPSFASNMSQREGGSDRTTNNTAIEIPFLTEHTFMTESSDDRQFQDRGVAVENPSLTEHYGVAPAWDDRQGRDYRFNTQEERMGNPSLRAINDNVE